MAEEKVLPKGWNTIFKSLSKKQRDYINEGLWDTAYLHPEHYRDEEKVITLFLMQRYADKWDLISKKSTYLKYFVFILNSNFSASLSSKEQMKRFKEGKPQFTMNLSEVLRLYDKFIETHDGKIPEEAFLINLWNTWDSLSDDDWENPSTQLLEMLNNMPPDYGGIIGD